MLATPAWVRRGVTDLAMERERKKKNEDMWEGTMGRM
jgi:hypothetical protein